jgi:outer membrane protein OmpA-like peptidoglycan-associated protein
MKKNNAKVLTLIALAGTMAAGCQLLKDVDYTVTPDPLEMHGDSVRVKVDVIFPEKALNKKAIVDITPSVGDVKLKPVRVQGEKATGNGNVIAYKAGGTVTYTDVVVYHPSMEASGLFVEGKIYKGEKEKDQLEKTKIADATIVTPFLVNKDFKVIIAKDEFRRVTEETFGAQINFDKGRSVVKPGELKADDVKAYEAFLAAAQSNPKQAIKSINMTGFASPEGEEDKNNSLSTDRAAAGKEAGLKIAKSAKNEAAAGEVYNMSGSGEDYNGFKALLSADTKMNEDDKNLVLRVLETINGSAEREQAMRDMGKTFSYLDKNVFPELRRVEMKIVYDQTGFSDEELKALSVSNPDTLNLEELLFTAALSPDDLNEQLRIYKIAETRFPEDYRTANNVGAVLYMQNKVAEAKAQFEKANGVQDNPISKNNLGAVAGVEGNRTKSMELLNQANGAGSEVNYNKGILNIQDGDYADAVSNLGSDASFNKALAELLNGSAASVNGTIDGSDDKDSAQGAYLKAVAAARQDNLQGVVGSLTSAISKDASFKEKAAKDREFVKYFENASFTALVK